MSILWDESLATGVEELDAQHRELFSHFDRLLAACREGKGRDELVRTLSFLHQYVDYHFEHEEAFMESRGYRGLKAHRELHRQFRDKLEKLEASLDRDGAGIDLLARSNRVILDWIIQHVRNVDKKMSRDLRDDIMKRETP